MNREFNFAWIGVGVGALLLVAPQLLLRGMDGNPLFGGDDDSNIMRMGRICGLVILIIFAGILAATGF